MRPSLTLLFGLFAAALCVPAIAAAPQVRLDRMPRPHSRAPGAVKVDSELAAMDRDYRAQAADCAALAKQSDAGSWFHLGARRLLETPTLYSVEVAIARYCGTAYPDREATAVSFDLRTGKRYDLRRAFHVGNGHLDAAALPVVARFREATLKQMKDSGDCGQLSRDDVAEALRTADLSLGITRTYLIFYFGVPHAIAACFPPVQVPLSALADLADRAELRRLGFREPAAR